jgi:hypothetical protein
MTTPTNYADKHITLAHYAIRLEQRYPGIRCTVTWDQFAPGKCIPGHAVWAMCFRSDSLELLVKYGLATAEQFEREALGDGRRRKVTTDFGDVIFFRHDDRGWEVCARITDYENEEKPFTKKLQAETARMLKRFAKPKFERRYARPGAARRSSAV